MRQIIAEMIDNKSSDRLIRSMKKYNPVFKKMTFQLTPKYFGNGVTLNQNTNFKENCQRNKKRQSLCEV